jgi:hypothetical protein
VVGLEPSRESAGKTQRVAESGDHLTLPGDQDEVLGPHQLGDGRSHFGSDARRQRSQCFGGDPVRKQPFPERSDREVRNRPECLGIMGVDHQPGDLVLLVGYDGLAEKRGQRKIGQRHLCRDPLLRTTSRKAGERIARARRCGPGKQSAEIRKMVPDGADRVGVH